MRQLDRFEQIVRAANEPTLLSDQNRNQFESLAEQTFVGPDGIEEQFLTEEELHYLRIPKGSLDGRERLEVESHVAATVRFLTQIPWTSSLQNISRFAAGHHEKLNGTGYPKGVSADAIPLQTRILTVADIFDALTEADRPYKKAVTAEHALDILRAEAANGAIDSEIVRILIESQAYVPLIEKDWREL